MTSSRVLFVAGSPSPTSRTARVLDAVSRRLAATGVEVESLALRDLPPEALLAGDATHPRLRATADAVARADGLVLGTPIYKAAYSGLLKVWLDQLPQFAFRDKVVLPIAVGGSLAHVLAIDYALRPVLSSLDPRFVAQGYFVLESLVGEGAGGAATVEEPAASALFDVVDRFERELRRR